MNDPHVKSLGYRIEHDTSVDYERAKPFSHDEEAFSIVVDNLHVRFRLNEHHATKEEARQAIDGYIRAWEFDAQLNHGPRSFKLIFTDSEIIDRNPTGREVHAMGIHDRGSLSFSVTMGLPDYPKPPSDIVLCPDATAMHHRYMGYLLKHEPLPSMAYFCLSMLEMQAAKQSRKRESGKRKKRKNAAKDYGIDIQVLDKIGRLSTTKGDADARKGEGVGHPLSAHEQGFLQEAIKRIVRRVAERAACPDGELRQITLADLPRTEEEG